MPLRFGPELKRTGLAKHRRGAGWREDRAEPGVLQVAIVIPGSAAADAGIRPGDRIYRIDGSNFANGEEFRTLVMSLPAPVEVTLERQGRTYTIRLNVPPPADAE